MRASVFIAIPLLLTTAIAFAAEQAVSFLNLRSDLPADWTREQPGSAMRLLQYRVPGEEGGAAFVVYYFGPGQGGSVEANVERWVSQFSNPSGEPVTPSIEPLKGALPATLVELRGSYARGVGLGPTGEALPDQMLLAAVVETPRGNLYPQLHGPAAVVSAQRDAFVHFAQGITTVPGD